MKLRFLNGNVVVHLPLVFATSFAFAITRQAAADSGDIKWFRREDSRLATQVSIVARNTSIRTFLQRLSTRTDVPRLTISSDSSGDVRLTASIRNQPITDVMDSIQSLLSSTSTSWYWERTRDNSEYKYRLVRSLKAQQYGSDLRAWLQRSLDQHVSLLLPLADMPSAHRSNERKAVKAALFGATDSVADQLLARDDVWDPLHMFVTAMTPEERRRVLSGTSSRRIEVSSLSDRGKRFIDSLHTKITESARGRGRQPPSRPQWVRFALQGSPGAIATTVIIEIENLGRFGILGYGLGPAYARHVREGWLLPGDDTSHTKLDQSIKASDKVRPMETPWTRESLRISERVLEFAETSGLSMIARLPLFQINDPGPPHNVTVGGFIDKLQSVDVIYKWRGDMLILDTPSWPFDELLVVGESYVLKLYEVANRNGGFFPLETLAEIASSLTPDQITILAYEFPIVMTHCAIWRDLLRLCRSSPGLIAAMRSSAGAEVTAEIARVLTEVPGYASRISSTKARLFVREESENEGGTPFRSIGFVLNTIDGQFLAGQGFRMPQIKNEQPPD